MSKQVVFQIGDGNFDNGFPIKLQIRENGLLCVAEVSGRLLPAPEIPRIHNHWLSEYLSWGKRNGWWRAITVPNEIITNSSSGDSEENTSEIAPQFEQVLNDWLDRSSIQDIRDELLHTVGRNDSVSFIIETENSELQKIPWELWRLLRRRYRYAEVALSNIKVPQRGSLSLPVKILVILGSNERIDIETDWNIIQNRLPNAQLDLLRQPSAIELREKLRSQPSDIMFFAGHSATRSAGNDARIWINDQESLSPSQLNIALETAVENGLKLAIFNSCDGLGLARQLANLQIPHVIVMRQPIHDNVAQRFLDDLLNSFASGASLHQAMREARDRLRLIENSSPNASLLPVLFQNPEEPPLFYPQANPSPPPVVIPPIPPIPSKPAQKVKLLSILSAVVLLIPAAWLFNSLFHQAAESAPGISLGEEVLFKNSSTEKEAGVKAFAIQDYSRAIAYFKAALKHNPKDSETQIYLNNAIAATRKEEPLKIAVGVPIGSNQPVAEEILQPVAQLQEEIKDEDGINGKLLQVVIANDNNKGDLAQKVADKFVKDTKILAVVGHNASNASVAASDIYNQGELVMITPTSFSDKLQDKPYIFRMVPQITYFAAKLSNFIRNQVPNPKVGICLDPDAPDNESFKKQFEQVLKANKGQSIELQCNFSSPNFKPSSVVAQIKKNNVNALLMSPHIDRIAKAVEIFKAVQDSKLQLRLFGSPSLNTNKTIELGGKAVEGLTISVPWYQNATGKNSFVSKFQSSWHPKTITWRW
jgi:branched-chain amino acid transport system substrate-binding protein